MKTSHLTHQFAHDLHSLAQLGGPELVTAVEKLGVLMIPIVKQRMLEQMASLVAEYNQARTSTELELRVGVDTIVLVAEAAPPPPSNESIGDLDARFALRLPSDLKDRIDALATAEGISTNSWVVRTLNTATTARTPFPPTPPQPPLFGQTLRGRGRS